MQDLRLIGGLVLPSKAQSAKSGCAFFLPVYASYGMRENSIFNQIDLQTITLFFIGAIASVIGIVLGYAFFTVEKNTPKSE